MPNLESRFAALAILGLPIFIAALLFKIIPTPESFSEKYRSF